MVLVYKTGLLRGIIRRLYRTFDRKKLSGCFHDIPRPLSNNYISMNQNILNPHSIPTSFRINSSLFVFRCHLFL